MDDSTSTMGNRCISPIFFVTWSHDAPQKIKKLPSISSCLSRNEPPLTRQPPCRNVRIVLKHSFHQIGFSLKQLYIIIHFSTLVDRLIRQAGFEIFQ